MNLSKSSSEFNITEKPRDRQRVEALLELADIQVNGNRPWDIQVHDPGFSPVYWARGRLAWASPTWTAGGIARRWM